MTSPIYFIGDFCHYKKTAGKIEIIRLKIRKRTATDSSCRGEVKISFSAKRDFSLPKVHKHSFEVSIMRHTIYQYQYYLIINTVVRYRCGFFVYIDITLRKKGPVVIMKDFLSY